MKNEFILAEAEKFSKGGYDIYGIVGDPVSHSLSPLMHNLAFKHKKIKSVYLPFHITAESFTKDLGKLKTLGIKGLSVTIPHKKRAFEYADKVTPRARKVGAVNTLIFKNNEVKGENTDIDGFLVPIKEIEETIKHEDVTIIGGGATARTALFSLLQYCEFPRINLITRSESQGNELLDEAENWRKHGTVLEYHHIYAKQYLSEAIWDSRLIVNCTSIGMTGVEGEFPVNLLKFLRPGQFAYDVIYTPLKTKFLLEAEQRGAMPIPGLEMLIGQGAKAFKLWTGKKMSKEIVLSALLDELNTTLEEFNETEFLRILRP